VLERVVNKISNESDAFYRAIYSSFLVSADMAHALHPNYADMHDPINRPIINKGPVIKINANQKYTTESNSDSVFEMICKKAEIPYQKFVNRSDLAGGSTLGSILTSQLDIRSVDVGNPMLAMHSIRETAGVIDHYYMKKAFTEFYGI
jgi:aspartyl aminopeptidase